MIEHPSLKFKPKPLLESEEINAIAKKAVMSQIEKEIKEMTQTETQTEQILFLLEEIKQHLLNDSQQNKEYNTLKFEVLNKLKNKLEEK